MHSHEIDYKIVGNDMQLLEIELDPNETVIAEAGMMSWMDSNIKFETKAGDGSNYNEGFFGKVVGMGKRAITGESLFLTHFTNIGNSKAKIGFASPYPGKIVPIDLSKGKLVCQKDAFLAAALGTKLTVTLTKRIGAGFFGGDGFILQRLEGDGLAFVHAGGTIIKKELQDETIYVESGSLVGFTQGIDYDIKTITNLKSLFFGGEGAFLSVLKGTGTVYLQSLPFSKLADSILSKIPPSNS